MHCQRGWSEGDLRLTDDVLRRTGTTGHVAGSSQCVFPAVFGRRMARGRGKRGFGNAREAPCMLHITASEKVHNPKLQLSKVPFHM